MAKTIPDEHPVIEHEALVRNAPRDPAVRRRSVPRAGWPSLLVYSLTAGTLAAATAYAFGGLGVALAGRRTYAGAALQILSVVLVVSAAGMIADRFVSAVRRRSDIIFRRRP